MKASIVLLIGLGLTIVFRRRSAALRHWVLAAAIGSAALLPMLELAMPSWSLPLGRAAAFERIVPAPEPPASGAGDAAAPASAPSKTAVVKGTGPSGGAMTIESVTWLLRPLWFTGMALSLAMLAAGFGRLAWLASRSQRLTAGPWVDLAAAISRDYGLQRPVVLLQSAHPTLLVTWGLARPKVMLPASARDWSADRARVVLSHELAHISRGDWIVYIAAEILRAAYWFNPVMWVVCRQLRLESEHACDDEVMSRGVEGTDYAAHLLEVARALNQHRLTWLPAPAMARPSSLERRVRAMLNDRLNRSSLTLKTRAIVIVALLVLTGAIAAAQNTYTTLSGSVMDQTGARISNTTVTLSNVQRQAKYEVKTDSAGAFQFVGLPPGEYELGVLSALGFRKHTEIVKVVAPGSQRDVMLQIGSLEETIIVAVKAGDPPTSGAGRRSSVSAEKEAAAMDTSKCVVSTEGGRIVPPRKLRDVSPIYPANAQAAGAEGVVVMRGRIGVDGFVSDLQVVGEAQSDFVNAAHEAIRQWKFSPTLLNCAKVEPSITITTRFEKRP